jgi:hypothetical protein
MTIPYTACDTTRFAAFASTTTARATWRFLAQPRSVAFMSEASSHGHAAVEPLIPAIRKRLEPLAGREGIPRPCFKRMCLIMCRQVMEHHGYTHVACALLPGRYFDSAGLFGKAER